MTYQSEQFDKDFTFFVKVQIKPRKAMAAKPPRKTKIEEVEKAAVAKV